MEEEEKQLTNGWRAWNPNLSPDGKKLVFARGSDGTVNVTVCDVDGKNMRQVTRFTSGEQVFTPRWSPDGTTITFGYATDDKQAVAMVREDGTGFKIVVQGPDARNPVFSPDGRYLYYSKLSRKNGFWAKLYDLYRYDLRDEEETQLTDGWRAWRGCRRSRGG